MPKINDRDFQMLARWLPGSGTAVDPLSSPAKLKSYGGDFSKMVPARNQAAFEAFRDEIGRDVDTYKKFTARYPGGKRPRKA